MIKIFIPEIKRRYNKTILARGFWRNESGKVYYDYINIIEYNNNIDNGAYELNIFLKYLETLRITRNQEAIFFVKDNKGYIFYGLGKVIEILNNHIRYEVSRKELRQNIVSGLYAYNGLTVYHINNKYFIEAYYNG
jgi:hypothetical protein